MTIKDIRALGPCYDPSRYLSEDWSGTVVDILLLEHIPSDDRVWVATQLLPRNIAETFVFDCATRAMSKSFDGLPFSCFVSAAHAAEAAEMFIALGQNSICRDLYGCAHHAARAHLDFENALQEFENQIDALLMLLNYYD